MDNVSWKIGDLSSEVYSEINKCPLITINLEHAKLQNIIKENEIVIEDGKDEKIEKINLDSDCSDDEGDVGEKIKMHTNKIQKVFGVKRIMEIKPIPCKRRFIKKSITLRKNDLKLFQQNKLV